MLEDVSACIIAKNEENNLPRLLNSIKDKFFEIVLVDTGSTDRTIDIAKQYGCKVFQTDWTGFADARNFAVEKASGKWIWHFDADTELEQEEYERFKSFYYLNLKDSNLFQGMNVVYKNLGLDGRVKGLSSTVHIHKKDKNIKWVGKVHERVIDIEAQAITVPGFVVRVLHYGYGSVNVQRDKAVRNLKLSLEELRKNRKNKNIDYITYIFYAIQSYIALSYIENKEKNLRRSLKYIYKYRDLLNLLSIDIKSVFVKHFYVYSSLIFKSIGDFKQALKFVEEGLSIDPLYPDLLYTKAEILESMGNMEDTTEWLLRFIYSLDKIEIEKQNIVSDSISKAVHIVTSKLPEMILEFRPELLEDLAGFWEKEKGLYSGILLFSIKVKQGKDKEAEKILTKLSRIYEHEDFVFLMLSKFYRDKNILKSIEYMKKVISLNSLNPEANLFFGNLFEEKGNYEDAIKFYLRYLQVIPDESIKQRILDLSKNVNKTY